MDTIALTGPLDAGMRAAIDQALPDGFRIVPVPTPAEYSRLEDADYIIMRTVELRADTIRTLRRMKLIQRWGVGYDIIDIQAAGARGIPVAIMVGINAVQVTELTIMLILAVYRNLIAMHTGILEKKWPRNEFMERSYTLRGKTVGLIGLGNIGRKLARLVQAFGATVQYFDTIRAGAERERELGVRYVPFEQLLRTSDILSLHIPLSETSRGMIDRKAISLMKPTAILINTSRGGIVNEADLFEALEADRLLGAGLDVFEHEPLEADSPLRTLKNVVLTPHVGGNTVENNHVMARRAMENILKIRSGLELGPPDLVNGQFLQKTGA
jgi:phosphoglycerate dehydrogenase-like enzyme